jgi:nitroreductase
METWQAINTVRVVRRFSDRPLARDDLERILNAGRRTGSSRNEQRWAFIVVETRERLRDLVGVGRYAEHIGGAAVAIALVSPEPENVRQGNSIMWDLGRAAQNMVLAAWDLGIGSVTATVHSPSRAAELLGLPAGQQCAFVLSFGYPADRLSSPRRIDRAAASRSPKWSTKTTGETRVDRPAAPRQRGPQAAIRPPDSP